LKEDAVAILIRSDDGSWTEPTLTGYENESWLQQLIAEHPSLIPGVSERAVACREFSSGIGPADVVILDESGDLTLIECKLTTNPQIRREIVGQVLDYASRLWGMRVDEFEARWRRAAKTESSPLSAFDDAGTYTRERLAENLQAGRMRLVLAVDQVNDDLKRIVEYLNLITLSEVSVFVMEFVHAQRDGVEVLMPTAYGAELAGIKRRRDQEIRERWPIEAFAEWGDQHDPSGMPAYRALRQRLLELGWRMNGGRASTPSLNASIDVAALGGTRKWPITMHTDQQYGMRLNLRFSDFVSTPEVAELMAVAVADAAPGLFELERLREVGFAAKPRVPFSQLSAVTAIALVDALTDAFRNGFSSAQ
jgi:hypothetical protein